MATTKKSVGSDDYALSRVPKDKRLGFWTMLLQWLAQSGSISQFTLGATIGVGMTFGDAFLAFTLGAVILEIVIFLIGMAGMREGLATPLLTRWVGFGRNGSALVSFVIAVSLVGWFGVQNTIFGDSVSSLVGGPSWLWCIVAGLAITVLVIFGFRYMAVMAKIVTPSSSPWSPGPSSTHSPTTPSATSSAPRRPARPSRSRSPRPPSRAAT